MRALTHTEEDTLYAKALKELKYGNPYGIERRTS